LPPEPVLPPEETLPPEPVLPPLLLLPPEPVFPPEPVLPPLLLLPPEPLLPPLLLLPPEPLLPPDPDPVVAGFAQAITPLRASNTRLEGEASRRYACRVMDLLLCGWGWPRNQVARRAGGKRDLYRRPLRGEMLKSAAARSRWSTARHPGLNALQVRGSDPEVRIPSRTLLRHRQRF
jgi:hypothetical protein